MSRILVTCALCMVCVAARTNDAQRTVPGVKTPVSTQATPSGTELLGPGDTLSIDIVDLPEVSTKSIPVGSDGMLHLPLAGSVQAAGLSVTQLRDALAKQLAKYINDPVITINVVTNASRFVSVIGEVNAPGLHPLNGPLNLLEVLSESGGLKSDAGFRVIVTRSLRNGSLPAVAGAQLANSDGSSRLSLSLNELTDSSNPAGNIPILPGDVVSVPKEKLIYVVGNVRKAGGFPLSHNETMTVLQAISLAEGSSPNASLKAAKILRPLAGNKSTPTEIPVNLQAILAGKAPDQVMFADDVLFVPNSAASSGAKRAAEIMLQIGTGAAIYR